MRLVTVSDPSDEAFCDLAFSWLQHNLIWSIDDLREQTPDVDFSITGRDGRSVAYKCVPSPSTLSLPVEVSRRCDWTDLTGWLHSTQADRIAFVSQSHIAVADTEALRAANRELLARWEEGAELSLAEEEVTRGEITSTLRSIPSCLVVGVEVYVRP